MTDEKRQADGGECNPATGEIEAKIIASGFYKLINKKDFADIKTKSNEMQRAIKELAARTLADEMHYKMPADAGSLLSTYTDQTSIASWVGPVAALVVQTNLIMKRDGSFSDTDNMTCGDTAIIMKRQFDKLW